MLMLQSDIENLVSILIFVILRSTVRLVLVVEIEMEVKQVSIQFGVCENKYK